MTDDRVGADADAPIVVFGDDWQRFVSTIQHLFAHIVTRRRVVWVNSFGHRAPQLTLYDVSRAVSKVRYMLRGHTPDDTSRPAPARIIEPRALPWHNLSSVRALNTWSLVRDIRSALHEIAPGERPVLITGTPAAEGIVGALGERAAIYFCMDDYAELPGVDRSIIAPLERMLLSRVDATIATAAALTTLKSPASGIAYQLPQGVNYERFAARHPIPPDLAACRAPRIGFSGTLSSACDFAIFRALAGQFPDATIVHVGPTHPNVAAPDLPNFRQLGPKHYDALPSYVQHFDVGLIPYVLNDWTRSVDPLKLLEYLASGIPVVTTPIPEVQKYASAISLADTAGAFVDAVGAHIARGPDRSAAEARQALARMHTWERRADRLLAILDEVVASRSTDVTSRSRAAR